MLNTIGNLKRLEKTVCNTYIITEGNSSKVKRTDKAVYLEMPNKRKLYFNLSDNPKYKKKFDIKDTKDGNLYMMIHKDDIDNSTDILASVWNRFKKLRIKVF